MNRTVYGAGTSQSAFSPTTKKKQKLKHEENTHEKRYWRNVFLLWKSCGWTHQPLDVTEEEATEEEEKKMNS